MPHLPCPCVSDGVHYSKLEGLSTYGSHRQMCSKAGIREARYGHVPRNPCRAMDRPTSFDKRVAHWSMAMSLLASSTSRKRMGFTGEFQVTTCLSLSAQKSERLFSKPLVDIRCETLSATQLALCICSCSVCPLLVRSPGFPYFAVSWG
jgi:hypothetical protein